MPCYKTEQDFAEIAGLSQLLNPLLGVDAFTAAGLNWVRIPIGFWAVETINNEPFLARTSWTYFLKASVLLSNCPGLCTLPCLIVLNGQENMVFVSTLIYMGYLEVKTPG